MERNGTKREKKENKQTVFDDFISAASWLIQQGYTKPSKLAAFGVSNGGLLIAASMNQRRDLFGACAIGVGVLDMLRFDQFTIGWAWQQEFGSPANQADFYHLLRYSPYHNVRYGTCYPACLITTADHDDRVVPIHSFKYAAALQHAQKCDHPILIRIETKAGHGAGKPTSKILQEITDRFTFFKANLE